jgi:hypothetical protein
MTSRITPLLLLVTFCFALAPARAEAETRTFALPTVKGVRLDWCKNWARQCGEPAAILFCRENGYQRAVRWTIAPGVGRTLVFGDGRLCQGPLCSGFSAITCERVAAAPPPALQPGPTFKPLPTPVPPVIVKPGPTFKPLPTPPPPVTVRPIKPPVPAPPPPVAVQPITPPAVAPPALKPAPAPAPEQVQRPPALTPVPVPVARPPPPGFLPDIQLTADGPTLIQCWFGTACTEDDVVIEPEFERQVVKFQWDISKLGDEVSHVIWQVADQPFPAATGVALALPPGLIKSERSTDPSGSSGVVGTFFIDFKELAAAEGGGKHTFHVHTMAVARGDAIAFVGGPSNVIRIFYGHGLPPQEAPPLVIHTPPEPPKPDPLFAIDIVNFTPPIFEDPNDWGCVTVTGYTPGLPSLIRDAYPVGTRVCPKSYKGKGEQITSFGEFVEFAADKVTGAWDWIGEKFDEIKAAAVDTVMKYTGVRALCGQVGMESECRQVASTALDAGLATMGIPPTIPSYNELVDKGVDYAVDVAVEEIQASTGAPCIGPCRDALEAGVKEFADKAKRQAGKQACVGEEEAHMHGKEPLCLPGIEVSPAPGAVYAPPMLTVRVTRRPEIPDPGPDHVACSMGASMKVKNFFEGGDISVMPCTGCTVRSKNVAPQDIQATLFEADSQPIPLKTAAGAMFEVPVVFNKRNRFIARWTKELYADSQIDVQPSDAWRDFFVVYSGGTAELSASSECAEKGDSLTTKLPAG